MVFINHVHTLVCCLISVPYHSPSFSFFRVCVCRWPRIPTERATALDFGATPVNESKVHTHSHKTHPSFLLFNQSVKLPKDSHLSLFPQIKNFTLKNPTASVVSVEIRTLSSYPAPLEALDLLTKWYAMTRPFSAQETPH